MNGGMDRFVCVSVITKGIQRLGTDKERERERETETERESVYERERDREREREIEYALREVEDNINKFNMYISWQNIHMFLVFSYLRHLTFFTKILFLLYHVTLYSQAGPTDISGL